MKCHTEHKYITSIQIKKKKKNQHYQHFGKPLQSALHCFENPMR